MDLLTRTGGYTLLIADDAQQVAAAQRLRYQVFAGELGATLHTTVPGHDVDEFDDACDHLIVRDDKSGAIVGTYRMLLPGRAPPPLRRHRVRPVRPRPAARRAGGDRPLVRARRSTVPAP